MSWLENSTLDPKVKALILKEDEKLNILLGYNSNQLASDIEKLIQHGSVEVGYRSSCGKTDPTMKAYAAWVKVLKALKKTGIQVDEVPVKHGNGWATKAGGFWSSNVYTLGKS